MRTVFETRNRGVEVKRKHVFILTNYIYCKSISALKNGFDFNSLVLREFTWERIPKF